MSRFAKVPEEIFLDEGLDAYSKMAMVTLLLHADSSGKAFPSINTLTRLSGMGKATLVRRLSRLEKMGYLTRQKRKDKAGDYDRTLYVLSRGLSQRETTLSPQEAGVVSGRDNGCLTGSIGVVSEGASNIPIEQTIEHTREQKNQPSQSQVSKPQPRRNAHLETIKAAFAEFRAIYPKWQGKKAAFEAFSGLFPAALGAERLNQRFQNVCGQAVLYADSVRGTELKYIKNPENWLKSIDPDEEAVVEQDSWIRVEGDE